MSGDGKKYCLRYPLMRLYAVSVVFIKQEPGGNTTISSAQGWRLTTSENEAIGSVVRHAMSEKPGFALALPPLVMEIPLDGILEEVPTDKDIEE